MWLLSTKYTKYLLYITFCIVTLSQLAYDPATLPLGFESAKVRLIQLAGVFSLITILWGILVTLRNPTQTLLTPIRLRFLVVGLLFYGLILVGAIFSPFPELMLYGSIYRYTGVYTLTSLLAIYFAFVLFYQPRYWVNMLGIYLSVIVFQGVLGLIDLRGLTWAEISMGFYVNGNYGQANFFADTLTSGLVVFYCLLLWQKLSRILRILMILSVLILLISIYLSFSTTGWINLGFFTALFILNFWLHKLSVSQKKLLIFNVLVLLVYISATLIYVYNTDASRQLFWNSTLTLISQRPLLGYGSDTLSYAFQQNGMLPGRLVDRAHNFYLDYVYNFGILAVIPAFMWMYYLVKGFFSWRINHKIITTASILVVFALTGLVHTKSIYHYAEVFLWLAVLLIHLFPDNNSSRI